MNIVSIRLGTTQDLLAYGHRIVVQGYLLVMGCGLLEARNRLDPVTGSQEDIPEFVVEIRILRLDTKEPLVFLDSLVELAFLEQYLRFVP